MFSGIVKTLLKKKLGAYPPEFIDGMFEIFEKNPEFFKQIMAEADAEMKRGSSQEDAVRRALDGHKKEIMEMFSKNQNAQ